MRQVREVLRLKHAADLSERQIAAALRISRPTVAEYLRRASVVGITWPAPAELDDATLEARLFSPPFAVREAPLPQPDWARPSVAPPSSREEIRRICGLVRVLRAPRISVPAMPASVHRPAASRVGGFGPSLTIIQPALAG